MAELLDINSMRGKVVMLVGPMNSGKTEKAIKWAENIKNHTDCKGMFFKPDIDKRAPPDRVVANTSEGKITFPATTISSKNPEEVLPMIQGSTNLIDVVFFDEINFFDAKIIEIFEKLKVADAGNKRVVVGTGLDKNFRGEPFEPVQYVTARADVTEFHQAYCKHIIKTADGFQQCKKPANYSMRLVLDENAESRYDFFDKKNNPVIAKYVPAKYYDPTVVVEKAANNREGASLPSVYYISVCHDCFSISGKGNVVDIYNFIRGKERGLEEIVEKFPDMETERIIKFLQEENRIVEKNGLFFPKHYVFDIISSSYTPERE